MSLQSDRERQFAKDRMKRRIESTYRHYDDNGEMLFADHLRDDFDTVTDHLPSLTALWLFLSDPLRTKVKEEIKRPALEMHLSDGSTWQDYDRDLLSRLEKGEQVDF